MIDRDNVARLAKSHRDNYADVVRLRPRRQPLRWRPVGVALWTSFVWCVVTAALAVRIGENGAAAFCVTGAYLSGLGLIALIWPIWSFLPRPRPRGE